MTVAIVTQEDQKTILLEKTLECYTLISTDGGTENTTEGCPPVWDGVLCWPQASNGTTLSLPCPDYVNGFKIDVNATRTCDQDGNWWVNPEVNDSWTNLTLCFSEITDNNYDVPEIIAAHMGRLRLMYTIGYGVSLVSLVLAVTIMLYFKRLHCPRNMIHINLFVSFILRATISFVKENVLVNGVGFPIDVDMTEDGTITFLENGSHWQCKSFFSFFNYILAANYMWILAEGVYLHMLITVAMFSENSGIKRLILFGWGAPVVFVVPWVIIRATLEDVLCWNTHPTHGYFWMIRGPIVAAMVINFIIFLNIIRVLFTKLNAFKTPDAKRKLAKSTLVLIPLFGVHYIVFIGLPDEVDETTELVKLYYEMFFNSFQGFFVSLLFCFLNGEVQGEIRKKWKRHVLKRNGNGFSRRVTRDTMTSFVSRARESIGSSTAACEKENQNGKTKKTSEALPNMSLSSDNSESNDINGHVSMQYSENESQPMVDLSSLSHVVAKSNESEPMLNNNINIRVTEVG